MRDGLTSLRTSIDVLESLAIARDERDEARSTFGWCRYLHWLNVVFELQCARENHQRYLANTTRSARREIPPPQWSRHRLDRAEIQRAEGGCQLRLL